MKTIFNFLMLVIVIAEYLGSKLITCIALETAPVSQGTPEQRLSAQIKEILPNLVASSEILKAAQGDHSKVKEICEQLKNLEGSVTSMSDRIVKLGNKHIEVRSTGWDDEKKMDFTKMVLNVFKFGKNHPEKEACISAIKQVQGKYAGEKAAMNTGTDSQGGFLVPEPFSREIQRVAEDASLIMAKARRVPIDKGNKIPVLSLVNNVRSYWIGEAQPITEIEPTFNEEKVKAQKLAAYSLLSNEMLEDDDVGIADFLVELFGEDMGIRIDAQAFSGTGAGVGTGQPFTGIMNTVGVNTVTMAGNAFSSVSFDNLSDMVSQLKRSVINGAGFIMHRTIFNVLKKLKDSDGQYLYSPAAVGSPSTIWGWTYELADQMPALTDSAAEAPFIIFGNLKNFFYGTKGEMTIQVDNSLKLLNDQSIILCKKRVAMVTALPGAFSVLKTGTGS